MRVFSGKTIYKIKERLIVYDVFIIPYTKYGILASKGAPKAHLNKRSRNLNIKLNRKATREVYETIIV